MRKDYNSRQRKIWEEYNLYSSDMLSQMVLDRKNYKSEIIGTIKDILSERNRGFYTPEEGIPVSLSEDHKGVIEPEMPDIPPENQIENTEPVDDGQTIYEEVPWLRKTQVFIPGISGPIGEFATEVEDEAEIPDEDDVDIEAEKEKYWKCPSCGELVEMEYDVCWKCQAEMPKAFDHPEREEIIKVLKEESGPANTFGIGLGLIGVGGLIFLFDRSTYYHFNDFIHNDIFRYFFSSLFGLLGLFFIIIHFSKKSNKEE